MKRLAKLFCMAGLLFCSAGSAFSYSAKDLVGAETYASLQKSGSVSTSKFGSKNYSFTYLPKTELCQKVPANWKNEEKPNYICEYLYLFPKKADISKSSKIIRSISKLKGIQYYSHTHRKTETLYKDVYCYNPLNGNKVSDPVEGSAEGKSSACMMDDNSLGKICYSLFYRQTEKEVSVSFTNLTPVTVMKIKAIDDFNLQLNMVITDCGDEFLIYLNGSAKIPELSVLENKMNDSISARVEALFTWFENQF